MKLIFIIQFFLLFFTFIGNTNSISIKDQHHLTKITEQNKLLKQEEQPSEEPPNEENNTNENSESNTKNDEQSPSTNEKSKNDPSSDSHISNKTISNQNISSILKPNVSVSKRPYKVTQCDQNILFKGQTIENFNNYCNKTDVYFEFNAYLLNVFNGTSPSKLIHSINMHHLKKYPKIIKGNNQCIKFVSETKEKITLCVSDEKEASEVIKAYDSLMECHANSKGKKVKNHKCPDKKETNDDINNNKNVFNEMNEKNHNKKEKIHYYHYPGDVLIVPGSREQIKLTKHQKELLQKEALNTNII